MNRIQRAAGPTVLAAILMFTPFGEAVAQCDPDAGWQIHAPTGDVAEILTVGQTGWIAAKGGVVRIDLAGVAGGAPAQIKITDSAGLVSTDITCMAQDGFGNIWVGTRDLGVSVFDGAGTHVGDLNSFEELWSDKVISMHGLGDRVVIVSADEFLPNGSPSGGGFVIITVVPDGDGYRFEPTAGTSLAVGQESLVEVGGIWFGTSGNGLWLRDETVAPATFTQVLNSGNGLPSNNVKKLARAPAFGSASEVLWIGTGAGLITMDSGTGALDTIAPFAGHNILDLWPDGNTMWVLSEVGTVRDLFSVDLTVAPAAARIPRSTCFPDTDYVPREVAVDSAGRVVLGTMRVSFSVLEGFVWYCPPSLGPHAPQISDLVVAPGGMLYFGTGDKQRDLTNWNGVGTFDGASWGSITRDDGTLHPNMTEVEVWSDGSIWFGSTVDRFSGGVNRWFPATGAIEAYHNEVQIAARRTQGRNCYSLRLDRDENLWIVYGQSPGGGLSRIDRASGEVTNYDFATLFPSATDLLRDVAFDSQGRLWVVTTETDIKPAHLYVLDLANNRTAQYNMATQIVDLDECHSIVIDGNDRAMIAGANGLAYGIITPGSLVPDFIEVVPSGAQDGGRNPPPYLVAELDWEDNFWLGTASSGLVRISNDLATWTWYDAGEGCPLPDQSVKGLHADLDAKVMWVGTASGGIARIDLSATAGSGGADRLDPEPVPNPWNPEKDGVLGFAALPVDRPITLRIWTSAGELAYERLDTRGTQTWNGNNTGGKIVESGIYLITAQATDDERTVWEGKVAVIR